MMPSPNKKTAAADSPSALIRNAPLLFILLLALGLRLWGIGWGLPNATRLFSYHPDESLVVGASLTVNPFAFQFDPGFYNYGSLGLLLNSVAIHLGEFAGLVPPGPAQGVPSATALLVARLVTAFLGVGTCGFLFGAGRRLYGAAAGIAAAIFYAITPLAVQHGHFATVDVPATFFVAGAIYFAVRHLEPSSCRPRDLLWCGLWSGFAAATKYNTGLVILAGLAAWWLTETRPAKSLIVLIGAAVFGFLVGCPAILLNFTGTLGAILYESAHARSGHGDVFDATPPAFIYHAFFNLRWGLGWPLADRLRRRSSVYALYRRRPGDLLLLAFALPFYMLMGTGPDQIRTVYPAALSASGLIGRRIDSLARQRCVHAKASRNCKRCACRRRGVRTTLQSRARQHDERRRSARSGGGLYSPERRSKCRIRDRPLVLRATAEPDSRQP